jgi:hypothetical protein
VTGSNVFQLSQPDTLCDRLTEVLRSGARALLAQAVAAEVAGFGIIGVAPSPRVPCEREYLLGGGARQPANALSGADELQP